MIKLTPTHKKRVNEILSESFSDNKSILFVVKNDQKEKERIRRLIDYSIEYGEMFGDVYLSDDSNSACIVLYPEKISFTIKFEIYWNLILATKVIGLSNILKVLKRQALLKAHQPKDDFYHLWYIGVDPDLQGKGIGSKLMKEVLNELSKKPRPVYLETSTVRNIPWYQGFGFEVIDKLNLSYELTILKKQL